MVRGLELFREYFAEFKDRYVLIGGTATVLSLEDVGLVARATKDLDIVLCLETLDTSFTVALRRFVDEGGYDAQVSDKGKTRYYRFRKPKNEAFPQMLELFSKVPAHFELADDAKYTPIPVGEGSNDLSAILLDDDYYTFIHAGATELAGVTCLRPSHLIPLKAHAWLNLSAEVEGGKKIDQADIKKHRNDIVRLAQVIRPDEKIDLPNVIRGHLSEFLARAEADEQFKPEGVVKGGPARNELATLLRAVYGVDHPA